MTLGENDNIQYYAVSVTQEGNGIIDENTSTSDYSNEEDIERQINQLNTRFNFDDTLFDSIITAEQKYESLMSSYILDSSMSLMCNIPDIMDALEQNQGDDTTERTAKLEYFDINHGYNKYQIIELSKQIKDKYLHYNNE